MGTSKADPLAEFSNSLSSLRDDWGRLVEAASLWAVDSLSRGFFHGITRLTAERLGVDPRNLALGFGGYFLEQRRLRAMLAHATRPQRLDPYLGACYRRYLSEQLRKVSTPGYVASIEDSSVSDRAPTSGASGVEQMMVYLDVSGTLRAAREDPGFLLVLRQNLVEAALADLGRARVRADRAPAVSRFRRILLEVDPVDGILFLMLLVGYRNEEADRCLALKPGRARSIASRLVRRIRRASPPCGAERPIEWEPEATRS